MMQKIGRSISKSFKKLQSIESIQSSFDASSPPKESSSKNPCSILKSSTLWKKKSSDVNQQSQNYQKDSNSTKKLFEQTSTSGGRSEDDFVEVKQYSKIEREQLDRFSYKRAYSNKKKLNYDAEIAERILESLAKEANGQETNN